MDFSQSQIHKQASKHQKKRLTQDQVRVLEGSFSYDKKLEQERKVQLARELGIPPRQIAIWYQNKRARWKTQTLELEYSALQLRLDGVVADKKRLEREVDRLRGELQRTQEMVLGLAVPSSPLCSLSLSCEENGSPSLLGDANCHWGNAERLHAAELYRCLMGAEDPTAK
ncbi:hypothetical protein Scep_011434 [Stephania cephalantha]|uniref:Homeobox-leucine zipper protein n=2 Tax=Stephania TaxID=147243 RepID=A0AAP0P8X0_9MAGN